MILKSIEWRNFKSYSNIPTIINFDSINSVNLIIGDNGTGKSSIEEVIKFTLYGKLEDYNNSDIPNRINKNFYSKIEVECDGHVIIIERGLAPTIFAVSIDGEKIDTAGKSNVQNMLEEMYFKMPYSVFSNTLVLSVNSFKSLIDLNASEKRSILDKIFKFDQYNQILKLAKEDYKGITSNISRNEGSIQYSYNVKQNYEHQIEEIKKNEVSQEEIDNLQNQLDELNELYQQKIKMIGKLQDMEKKLKEDISNHRGQFNELKIHINEIDKKIALIDSGKCPTCGTNLDTDDFKKEKEELTKEKEEYINKQKTLQELAKNVMSKIDVLERKESTFQNEIKDMRISDLKSELKYKSNMKGKSIEPILKLKEDLHKDMLQLKEEYEILSKEKSALDVIMLIFGEDGIRKRQMSQNIPIINDIMSKTLKSMNLNYEVEFDLSFDGKITQNGYKIKYATLSTGEKVKIDFACVVTIIKFMKIQYGDSNVLFLDELFSNIHVNGVSLMIDIIKDLSKELNLEIIEKKEGEKDYFIKKINEIGIKTY